MCAKLRGCPKSSTPTARDWPREVVVCLGGNSFSRLGVVYGAAAQSGHGASTALIPSRKLYGAFVVLGPRASQ